jgi:putative FmdB family regulatory protein
MAFITDYLCLNCGVVWEAFLNNRHEHPECCPECESINIQRQLSATSTKMHDREVREAELKRRSREHSLKHIKRIAGHKGTMPPMNQKSFKGS